MRLIIYNKQDIQEYFYKDNLDTKIFTISNNKITLKSDYFFKDETKVKQINELSLTIKKDFETFELVFLNDNCGFKIYRKDKLYISSKIGSDLVYENPNIENDYLAVKDNILDSNSKYCVINGIKTNYSKIKENDHINLLGLDIYIFKDFFYISTNFLSIKLVKYKPDKQNIKYLTLKKYKPIIKNYIYPEYKFNNPKEYIEEKKKDSNILKTIGPSLTMSIPMVIVSIYNIETSNSSLINLVIPLSMLISTLLWPLIFGLVDKIKYHRLIKRNKKEYITYLNDYCGQTIKDLSEYKNSLKEYEFIKENLNEDKFNSLSSTNKMFLNVLVGYNNLNYEFKVNKLFLKEITKYNNELRNLSIVPYYLSLNNNMTIYYYELSQIINLIYNLLFFNNYNDYYICLYKAPSEVKNIFFKVSNLYYEDSRLITNSFNKLLDLEEIDKTLLIIGFDNIDYKFENEKVKYIYVTKIIEDFYKYSDQYLQLFSNYSLIFKDNKQIKLKLFNNYISFDTSLISYRQSEKNKTGFLINNLGTLDYINNRYLSNDYLLNTTFSHDEDLFELDLHESKDGPHGLICGTTGSGKSELIISLLLGLCMNYSPEYLNIIIVDYKGYSLSDSLKVNNEYLPHLLSFISNNEDNLMDRLIYRLTYECKYRETLFSKSTQYLNTSVSSIDEYLKYCAIDPSLPSLSHIVIVIDEFAQLKKEKPEFINSIISLSRIGRSLGIHLILSTQNPQGVIDDQINSNINYKICLKVNSEEESKEIIGSEECSRIHTKGEFYLKSEGKLTHLYSFYSGKDINYGGYKKISILNEDLSINKSNVVHIPETKKEKELIIENINKICRQSNYKVKDFNLRPNLAVPYKNGNNLYLGVIDDYASNLSSDFYLEGNILIYSNRSNEINTLTFNNELFVVISNKTLNRDNILSTISYYNCEDIKYLFKKLRKETRKLILLIDDLYSFLNFNDEYTNLLFDFILERIPNIKIIGLTYNGNLSYKIINLFETRLYLDSSLKKEIFMNIMPTSSSYKDTCQIYLNGIVYPFIPLEIKNYESLNNKIDYIDKIPSIIKPEYINGYVLIGYSIKDRKKVYIKDNSKYLICSLNNRLLEIYSKLFKFNQVCLYTKDLLTDNRKILWLGSGVNNKRIKDIYLSEDLKEDEAIFLDSKEERIKLING